MTKRTVNFFMRSCMSGVNEHLIAMTFIIMLYVMY